MICCTCGARTYNPNTGDGTSCYNKRTLSCGPGHYFYAGNNGQVTLDDTACVPCATGQYKAGAANTAQSCTSKKAACASGEYLTKTDATMDNTCTSCPPDTFKSGTDAEPACTQKSMQCGPGFHLTVTNSHQDNQCTLCAADFYKQSTSTALTCTQKATTCLAGEFFTPGSSKIIDDTTCTLCAGGWYKAGTSAAQSCTQKRAACSNAGHYLVPGFNEVKDKDDTTCTACSSGFFKASAAENTTAFTMYTVDRSGENGPVQHHLSLCNSGIATQQQQQGWPQGASSRRSPLSLSYK